MEGGEVGSILDFVKLNTHCALFILLQALFWSGSKNNLPYWDADMSKMLSISDRVELG